MLMIEGKKGEKEGNILEKDEDEDAGTRGRG